MTDSKIYNQYLVVWYKKSDPGRRGILQGNYTKREAESVVVCRTVSYPGDVCFLVKVPGRGGKA